MISRPDLTLDLPKDWIQARIRENSFPFFVAEGEHRLLGVKSNVCWYIYPDTHKENIIGSGGQTTHTFAVDFFSGKIAAHGWTRLNKIHKLQFAESEIECLQILKDEKGVIQNLGHYFYRDQKGFLFRGMLTEYFQRGHLRTEELVKKRRVVAAIIEIVRRIHQKGIIHRDLKLKNIFIDDQGEPVVADFGFACRINSSLVDFFLGSYAYLSPQLIYFFLPMKVAGSIKDDVWAIAVCMYKIFYDSYPPHCKKSIGLEELKKDENLVNDLLDRMKSASENIKGQTDIDLLLQKMFIFSSEERPDLSNLPAIDTQKDEVKPLANPQQNVIIQPGIMLTRDGRLRLLF